MQIKKLLHYQNTLFLSEFLFSVQIVIVVHTKKSQNSEGSKMTIIKIRSENCFLVMKEGF